MQEVNLPNYRLLQLGAPNCAGDQRNEQFDISEKRRRYND